MADIGFLLDASYEARDNFGAEKSFVKEVAYQFTGGSKDVRLGVVSFGADAKLDIKLTNHNDTNLFNGAVDNILFKGDSSRLDLALRAAQRDLFTQQRGSRIGVAKLLVVLTTTTQYGDEAEDPSLIVKELSKLGVQVVVIGINGINRDAIERMVGNEERMFLAKTNGDLKEENFMRRVASVACDYSKNYFSSVSEGGEG